MSGILFIDIAIYAFIAFAVVLVYNIVATFLGAFGIGFDYLADVDKHRD